MPLIVEDPYRSLNAGRNWLSRGTWPCKWISLAEPPPVPFAAAYRLRFSLAASAVLRFHVSADERYDLFFDGVRLGRGPERDDVASWAYETYEISAAAGEHVLAAKVWSLGERAPYAQMSVRHGFILGGEGKYSALLGTGLAAWSAKRIAGYSFRPPGLTWGAGAKMKIDGAAYPWGVETGEGDDWTAVVVRHPGVDAALRNEWPALHRLRPAVLPPQVSSPITHVRVRHVDAVPQAQTESAPVRTGACLAEELGAWQKLADGEGILTVPPHTQRRIVLDFENYQCAYPALTVSGGAGASVRLHWAEGLFEPENAAEGKKAEERAKGRRDQIEGKCFLGAGDLFLPDGGKRRRFETLWWAAGRYVEAALETADEPLTIEGLSFQETRYPLEMEGRISCDDLRWDAVAPLALRTAQTCAHETYMDCPYYEQLQYFGDTRLQMLVSFVLTRDDRLPRQALRMGRASIQNDRGLTQSRYPSRVAQIIPPFSLWWTSMLWDFALWRGDLPFIRALMPGARLVLDTFLGFLNRDGLLRAPPAWNFTDWVPEWTAVTGDVRNWGVPPDGEFGVSGVLNWHLVYTLQRAAELETWLDEPEAAKRWKRRADDLAARVHAAFWDERRGLYADDLTHTRFSEHAQCLALLGGALPEQKAQTLAGRLFADPDLARCTVYFTHYLFETVAAFGSVPTLFERMEELWFSLPAMGFKTVPERPEPSRSDCHAWGAHPLYHFYATILGLRPATPGFTRVVVRPRLGPLKTVGGVLPHPRGEIRAEFHQNGRALRGSIALPPGVTGELLSPDGRKIPLRAGEQSF